MKREREIEKIKKHFPMQTDSFRLEKTVERRQTRTRKEKAMRGLHVKVRLCLFTVHHRLSLCL
jgi:hypothetical protein